MEQIVRYSLEANVTLREPVGTLSDPEPFLRGVIRTMHFAAKEHGVVTMRLGRTGTGKLPNYRLEEASTGRPLQAIDGNGHHPWKEGENFTAPGNWSTEVMTRTEVEDVLGALTGYSRKPRLPDA